MSELLIDYSFDMAPSEGEEFYRDTVRAAVAGALAHENMTGDAEVSVTFTDDFGIHELNRKFRGVDRATDVLSFPMYAFTDDDMPPKGEPLTLGDIVISIDRARAQAEEYGHSLRREIAFLAVHSTLHLLGYDHETGDTDEREMFARQDEIMNEIGIPRS